MENQELLKLISTELSLNDNDKEKGFSHPKKHVYVAFSGGVDSTALLSLVCKLRDLYRFKLTALHANHQLVAYSTDWERHCQQVCKDLKVPFISTSLNLASSSEESAREARYRWFSQVIDKASLLLTAHHRQDRVETLLFNLFRGAGSRGLSSLRSKRTFYGSTLHRPLINVAQEELIEYTKSQGLTWVEDPSNENNSHSRNYIRNVILPTFEDLRHDAIQNMARAAWNLEQENNLLREVAISDLVEVREHPWHYIDKSYALCFEDFQCLSLNRQANLVRFWLYSLNLHTPSQRFLLQLLEAFIEPPTSTAVLQEGGVQFRFYKGFMYVMPAVKQLESDMLIYWKDLKKPIDLFEKEVRVDSTSKLVDLFNENTHTDFRLASRNQLRNPKALQGHTLNLKKWLQDIGVPPWRRSVVPILTMTSSDNDVVLGPIDQQIHNDWVMLGCPISEAG